jgi:alkylation response protein AidB-like acyl-CoA dehydrogenase
MGGPQEPGDEAFRREAREFLETSLAGEFAAVRGRGGPGDEHSLVEERRAWERHLGRHGWTGVGWPVEHGGRGAGIGRQLAFAEEYARAGGPGRVGHIGETLAGPTIIRFGTAEQQRRFLPPILAGDELWCQGYSEPDAGSDLAALRTRAALHGDEWVVEGQKIWTSLAQWADWCLLLARTDPGSHRHSGLSCLLVPMHQPAIEVRPIVQLTGTSEFNEVFFTGARAHASNLVGGAGEGWRVAMGTLGLERGISTLGQVLLFENEFAALLEAARRRELDSDPGVRQRIAATWSGLRLMRWNALRFLGERSGAGGPASINKLYWSTLHRDMGELAMAVLGAEGTLTGTAGPELGALQRLFCFSRADTIYAGTSEIQRDLIGERALGLPRDRSDHEEDSAK